MEDANVRKNQVDTLICILTDWSSSRAVVFTGDFNLHVNDATDAPLLERLLDEDGLLEDDEYCSQIGDNTNECVPKL